MATIRRFDKGMALGYTSTMKRTTIHLADVDRDAIKIIRERYGVDTDSAAIRLALRILAAASLQISEPKETAEAA